MFGLKIVYFFILEDVKGLFLVVLDDFNLVMFFEYKGFYCKFSGEVVEGYYIIEIGKVRLVCEGKEMLIIIYGMGVYWVIEVVEELGIDVEVLDLWILFLFDYEVIS